VCVVEHEGGIEPNSGFNKWKHLKHSHSSQGCWQKKEDGHLPSIRRFDDDDDLWRSIEDLMMMHGKMLKT